MQREVPSTSEASMRVLFALCLPLSLLGAQAKTSLRGSPAAMVNQNTIANKEHLSRIKNEEMIAKFVKSKLLVPLPDGKYGLRVNAKLEKSRRYCRPWTVEFLKDMGTRFDAKFKKPLTINSCVRDIETQVELQARNRNAAATSGPRASSHLTGSTTDIRRTGLSKVEQDFVRNRLLFHEKAGHIEATEEKRQPVWHVMVYKTYTAPKPRSKK